MAARSWGGPPAGDMSSGGLWGRDAEEVEEFVRILGCWLFLGEEEDEGTTEEDKSYRHRAGDFRRSMVRSCDGFLWISLFVSVGGEERSAGFLAASSAMDPRRCRLCSSISGDTNNGDDDNNEYDVDVVVTGEKAPAIIVGRSIACGRMILFDAAAATTAIAKNTTLQSVIIVVVIDLPSDIAIVIVPEICFLGVLFSPEGCGRQRWEDYGVLECVPTVTYYLQSWPAEN
mmetsp:Transcript_5963/g.12983  ORF Transcript_5963/g.12983 Transcript_5963/m.12983 type:complete len:230 (-) Transcript_5963:11-700(-)